MSEKWYFRNGVEYTVTQIEPPASALNVWGPFDTEINLVRRKLARMKASAERAALRDAAREKA